MKDALVSIIIDTSFTNTSFLLFNIIQTQTFFLMEHSKLVLLFCLVAVVWLFFGYLFSCLAETRSEKIIVIIIAPFMLILFGIIVIIDSLSRD